MKDTLGVLLAGGAGERLFPEEGDERADEEGLEEAHAVVRRHLKGAELE